MNPWLKNIQEKAYRLEKDKQNEENGAHLFEIPGSRRGRLRP
jgi:hypothetical protein